MLPPEAAFVYRRFSAPSTQRTPWPKTAPEPRNASPWSTMLSAVGPSPLVVSTSESSERRAMPDADRIAPPVPAALSHPRPGALGGFEQGQAITPSTPGEHTLASG